MKWTKEKLDLFFAMKDEGCSTDEIAEALGCTRQCIYYKTNKLKTKMSVGAGRTKRKSAKYDEILDSVDAGMREKDIEASEADLATADVESYADSGICWTDTDRDIVIEKVCDTGTDEFDNETHDSNNETPAADNENSGECSNVPRIVELAQRMAEYTRCMKLGEPTHFYCDINSVREEARVSGFDGSGKVYELELSVTDPQKAMQ